MVHEERSRGRTSRPQVLVIDDGVDYARLVAERMPEFSLVDPGLEGGKSRLPDGPSALEWLDGHAALVDVVLLDMRFDVAPERLLPLDDNASLSKTRRFQGVAIWRRIRERFPGLPVVLLTSQQDLSLADIGIEVANQSMTYLLDGDDLDSLRIRVNVALKESLFKSEEGGIVWGVDAAMRAIRRRLAVLAKGGLPIILEGETGTGKSFLAREFIHARSGRPGPFIAVDLSLIPQDLVAAHLFGALKGSYTGAVADRKGFFELAHRGTLFMDEIHNTPPAVQKQLLTVLQDRRVRPLGSSREIDVDVKVVAASNAPLANAVAAGQFRGDLYMRLSPATRVVIPPLRERMSDLALHVTRFVSDALSQPENAQLKERIALGAGLSPDVPVVLDIGKESAVSRPCPGLRLLLPEAAWKLMLTHPFPGNARELSMILSNAVTFTLVAAADALDSGIPLTTGRLQIDPGLVAQLLEGYRRLAPGDESESSPPSREKTACNIVPQPAASAQRNKRLGGDNDAPDAAGMEGVEMTVRVAPSQSLNAFANSLERQCMESLFLQTRGDFSQMAELLLGDSSRSRAVRLRFNQLGLKVREILRR